MRVNAKLGLSIVVVLLATGASSADDVGAGSRATIRLDAREQQLSGLTYGRCRAALARKGHSHRRPLRRRRAEAHRRDAEGQRLRRGALRRLHGEARPQGRAAVLDLQPGPGERGTGVSGGAGRAAGAGADEGAERRRIRRLAAASEPGAPAPLGPERAADPSDRRGGQTEPLPDDRFTRFGSRAREDDHRGCRACRRG